MVRLMGQEIRYFPFALLCNFIIIHSVLPQHCLYRSQNKERRCTLACLGNTVHSERMPLFFTRRTRMENTLCVLMVLSSNGHIQEKCNCSGINAEHTSIYIKSLHLGKKFLKHHTKIAVNGFMVTPCINIQHFIFQLMHTMLKNRVIKTF